MLETENTKPSSLFFLGESPERLTNRQLSLRKNLIPDSDIGFFGRIENAFVGETVVGELLREMDAPEYKETGFVATQDDIEKYASDIDPAAANRVLSATAGTSFAEFIYELDQVRQTEKRRKELFSGGAFGIATGVGATILAAGGEAVLLSLLASAAGTAMSGPGGVAAGGAVAVNRMHRIRGALKGIGLAAAIDVPLEATRYQLDKTLRPSDLIMALGASAGLSGAIGGLKPGLFLKELQGASETATLKASEKALREAGADELADEVAKKTKMSVRTASFDEDFEEVTSMGRKELYAEARRLKVATHKKSKTGSRKTFRSNDDIKQDIIEARQRNAVSPDMVKAQVIRETKGLRKAALIRMAKQFGAKSTGTVEQIRDSILATRQAIAKTGTAILHDVPKMPKGLNASSSVKIGPKDAKIKVKFNTTFEKVLWKLGTAKKQTEAMEEARSILKERGFTDPDALAKSFVKEVKKNAKGKTFNADVSKMDLPAARITMDDGRVVTGFTRKKKMDTTVDSDILGKTGEDLEQAVVVDGKVVAVGPKEYLEDVSEATVDPGRETILGHSKGIRESIARAIDHFPGDVPGMRMLYSFFAPVTKRLLRSHSSDVRKFATEFLENPRSGVSNVMGRARLAYDQLFGEMKTKYNAALEESRLAGQNLTGEEIIRAVRAKHFPNSPLGKAAKALADYHRDVKTYGANRGLDLASIPDNAGYIHRAYRTSKFNDLIEEFGGGETGTKKLENLITKAIMDHEDVLENGMTLTKAKAKAKSIVEYGSNPDATKATQNMQKSLDGIRSKLIEDGVPEEEIDSFLDLLVRKTDEPHLTYAKHRTPMNENFSMKIGNREVHVDELMNNDPLELAARYGHQIIGGAEVRVGLRNMFGDSNMTFSDMKRRIKSSIKNNPREEEFVDAVITHAYKGIVGQRLYANNWFTRAVMGANAFSQATIGMTLGFAQIPEISNILKRTSLKAAMQQLPALKEVGHIFSMGIRDVATGRKGLGLEGLKKMKDDLASVIETFTGVAGDYSRGDNLMRRMDDMGFDGDYLTSAAGRYLEWGRQVSMLNPLGVMPMDTFLRRWAARSSLQHFVNQAYDIGEDGVAVLNKGYWKNTEVKFAQLGLNAEDITRISKSLRDPNIVTTRKGLFGDYTVKNVDFDKMTDQVAANKFAYALRRHCDHMVQRQSFGETPFWMNTTAGKLLGQYRVFMMASKSKQMAAGIARGDVNEAVNVVGAIGLGSLAYYLQSYYRSLSMDEKTAKDYLDKRFSEGMMLRAGIMKSSYPNVFPMLIDSATSTLGMEPIFDPSMRTTGLGVNPITGSVPFSVMERGTKALNEATGAIFRGDGMSKKDWRDQMSLLWMTKVPGVEQLINRLWINNLNTPDKD